MKKKTASASLLIAIQLINIFANIASLPLLLLYLAHHYGFEDQFFGVLCGIYGFLGLASVINLVLGFKFFHPVVAIFIGIILLLSVIFPPYAYYNFASSHYDVLDKK